MYRWCCHLVVLCWFICATVMCFQTRSQNFDKRILASSCLSLCVHPTARSLARNSSVPSDRPFARSQGTVRFHPTARSLARNSLVPSDRPFARKEQFGSIRTPVRSQGTVRLPTFMIICRWILLIMRNASDKSWAENPNTHFMFNNFSSKIVQFMK